MALFECLGGGVLFTSYSCVGLQLLGHFKVWQQVTLSTDRAQLTKRPEEDRALFVAG